MNEWNQLQAEYRMYLERFYATHDTTSNAIPLTPREYCTATVLHAQAQRQRNPVTVAQLESVLVLT